MAKSDPNDADFLDNLKNLLGVDGKGVKALIPKLSSDVLIDLASAVANKDRKAVIDLITLGRQKKMAESRFIKEEEDFNVGDAVEVDGKSATVKIPRATGDTVGVMISGTLEMVRRKDITRKKEDIAEGVLGMTQIPDIRRMQELAGMLPTSGEHEIVTFDDVDNPYTKTENVTTCSSEEALELLDQVLSILPDVKLSDLKPIRQKLSDIQMKMNESVHSFKKRNI